MAHKASPSSHAYDCDHQRVAGKVTIVTGAAMGIGKAIATTFAKHGSKVVVADINKEKAEETAALINSQTGEGTAIAAVADMSKVDDIKSLVNTSYEQFGTVDVLVNNAGMEIMADFDEITEAQYDRVMAVNLKGPFFATQEMVKRWKAEKKHGNVICISSVHEDLPFPGFSPYCVSKGGMKMMTRNLSIELAPLGIRINNIAPGAIKTPINASLLNEPKKLNELMEKIPLMRLGEPEDVSMTAIFLASDESSYVTGTTIVVDGGLTWNYIENH